MDPFNWTPLMWILIFFMVCTGSMCSSLNSIESNTKRIARALEAQVKHADADAGTPVTAGTGGAP